MMFNSIKWAWQRLTHGWDDRAVWNIDLYLGELMPQLLRKLKADKQGIPGSVFDRPFDWDRPDEEARALAKWNAILLEMIVGFEAAARFAEQDYPLRTPDEVWIALREKDKALTRRALDLLAEYYFDLWD